MSNEWSDPTQELTPPEGIESAVRARLGEADAEDRSLRSLFGDTTDAEWCWILTEGRRRLPEIARRLPELPPEELQAQYTGLSGDRCFESAVYAASIFRSEARRLGIPVGRPACRLLDFGCGWGRITQVFLRDFELENITAVDVDPDTIELIRGTGIGCTLQRVAPEPPLDLPDGSVDLITAYSVFSHLSESVHWAWLEEFRRILRPGGVITVTTRPREFIDYVAHLRSLDDLPDYALGAAITFPDAAASYAKYDAGEICFDSAGGGGGVRDGFYGEALIPRGYVEQRWSKLFSEVGFISHLDHQRFDQNVLVARK